MSQRLWITYLMCWIAGMACGSVASVVPTYLPTIAERLVGDSVGPKAAELGSTVQSMFLFGWVLGGIALGLVADLRGRVPVLGVALVGTSLLTGLTPYVSSPLVFGAIRLLTGMCVGAIMVVSSTLGVEILPEKRRPLLMGILANSYAVGIVFSGALQSRALSYETVVTLFMLFTVPALVFFTPFVERSQDRSVKKQKGTISSQLSQSKREIAIGATLFGCMLITLWAAFSWLPTWASDLFPGTDGGAGVRGSTMMALGGGGIIGSLLVAPVVHWMGRVRGILTCYIGVVIGSLYLYGATPSSASTFVATIGAMSFFFGMSQALMSFYVPELFSAVGRATATGLCLNIGRFVTALAVLQIGLIADALGGFQQALLITSSVLLIGIAVIPRAIIITQHR
ncbi:MAG: MFS transporter [Bacteroidota bacterium]